MKTLARIGAIAFVAIAITMTAIAMRDGQTPAPAPLAPVPAAPAADPLRGELIRCQAIGQAGASDLGCLRAWAENRRRFLAPDARPEGRPPEQVESVPQLAGHRQPAPRGKFLEAER